MAILSRYIILSWAILPPLTIEHDHAYSQFVCDFISKLFYHHWPLNMTMSTPSLYVILSLCYSATSDHWTWPYQFLDGMWFYPWAILPPLIIEYDHVNSQEVCDFIPGLFCHHWPLNMAMSIPRGSVILPLSYSATTDHWIWQCRQEVCDFILSYCATTNHWTWPCQLPVCMWFYPWAILPPLTIEHDHVNFQLVCDYIPELFSHHWLLTISMAIPRRHVILSQCYSATTDHWTWPCQFPDGM
jgi:hypothetical protein